MSGRVVALKDICPSDDCTGCMGCLNVCAHSAIVVTEDLLGFRYPKINPDACTGCGLCSKVCPTLHPTPKVFPSECYAFALSGSERLASVASGGVASALSEFVVGQGGVVYGCSGEDIRACKHVRVDSKADLSLLKGSKYVQSEVGLIYRAVRADLRAGKRVLFIGTPCQTGGLRKFLLSEHENLITADLVCHGVASQRLLNENIDFYRRRYPDLVEDTVRFRSKIRFGTPEAALKYRFVFRPAPGADEILIPWYDDPFMLGFLGAASLRTSCFTCPYAYNVRGVDLTLSDFWGIGADAGFNAGDGVSAVLVNTPRGAHLWKEFLASAPDCIVKERPVRESISGNGCLMRPTPRPAAASLFRKAYPSVGLREAVFSVFRKKRLKMKLKKIIRPIRSLIK